MILLEYAIFEIDDFHLKITVLKVLITFEFLKPRKNTILLQLMSCFALFLVVIRLR